MKTVRVLIVDDSASMRALIAHRLSSDPQIEIVGQAGDPYEARQAIKDLNPDVLTLDIEMPNMNGLEFLEKIMRLRPMPVVMVSTLTSRATDATIRALETGAVACIAKPSQGAPNSFDDLAPTVKAAALAKMSFTRAPQQASNAHSAAHGKAGTAPNGAVIAIGSSTGGVEALIAILARFPSNGPPIVVTQHMPALFTRSFAQRLDTICAAEVREATDGAPLAPGRIYIAPGGAAHLEVVGSKEHWCRLRTGDLVQGHRPSVDVLFSSVARTVRDKAVGVILTGMGRDGAKGLLEMRKAGARTFGQDEATSIVYGMPKAAFEIGAVEKQLPLNEIPHAVLSAMSKQTSIQGDGHALR
jgi:two-component system chemotaxis response regulator CheB